MASGLLLLHPHSTTTPHFSTVTYHEKKQPVDCDSVRETTLGSQPGAYPRRHGGNHSGTDLFQNPEGLSPQARGKQVD